MAKYWTIAFGGAEKSFLALGVTDPMMRPGNLQVGTFTVRVPGATALTAAPPIAFETQVVIRRNRDSADGSDNSFGGGDIVFQGRQISRQLQASPSAPGYLMKFGDAWYDLDNHVFQQSWKYKRTGVPSSYQFFSRLNLFQNYATGGRLNSGQQISEILTYAITNCGVNLRIGTIDPAFNLLFYPVRAIMCSAALKICLQPTPDAATWIDHSTTPPTFHCRVRTSRTALNLPYADGLTHQSSDITPRYDLQASAVVLQYQKENQETSGGVTNVWTDFFNDVYPLGATGQELRALVCPLDLRGLTATDIEAVVSAVALDPTSLDWWGKKRSEAKALKFLPDGVTPNLALVGGSIKVIQDDGTDITATWAANWPNELVNGEVVDWMQNGAGTPITYRWVTVSAKFTYREYDPAGRNWHTVTTQNPHVFSTRIKITNSVPGDISYFTRSHYDPGETAPAGLAQAIHTSLALLDYEGTHTIQEIDDSGTPAVSTIIDARYALNLTGGAAAWSTMKANIQFTDIEFFKGRTVITIGAAEHIAPGTLEQLLQAFRFRVIYDNPNLQVSGSQSGTGSAKLGGATASENTSHGTPPPALHTVADDVGDGNAKWVQHDATNEQVVITRVDNAGSRVSGYPRIKIALPAAAGVMAAAATAGVAELNVELRVVPDCNAGTQGWRLALCSEFVPGALP